MNTQIMSCLSFSSIIYFFTNNFIFGFNFYTDVSCGQSVNSDGFDFASDNLRRDGQCQALLRCTEIHQGHALT